MESPQKTFEIQIVNIVGEMVAFTPTGFPKGEPSIVQFDEYYKPKDISEEDYVLLRRLMKEMFNRFPKEVLDVETGNPFSDMLSTEPLPPCGEPEKELVLQSLLHRKELLLKQLSTLGIYTSEKLKERLDELAKNKKNLPIEGQDTLETRRVLVHFLRLKEFIDKYDSLQMCVNLEDIAYGDVQLDLTDERVLELLKQFVFFTLQAHHPLQEFKKTDPTAPGFVKRLEKRPLGEQFPQFMTKYKANKLPIPDTIAQVLAATDLDPRAKEDELKRQIDAEKQKILLHIQSLIPLTNPFWKRVGDRNDLLQIIDALNMYRKDCDEEVARLNAEQNGLNAKVKACEQAKRLLEVQQKKLQSQLDKQAIQLQSMKDKDAKIAELTVARDALQKESSKKIKELESSIQTYKTKSTENQAKIDQLTGQLTVALQDNSVLRQQLKQLEELKRKGEEDIEALTQEFEKALADEKAQTAEQSRERAIAEEAHEAAERDLASKIAELATSKTELQVAKQIQADKEGVIGTLTKKIQDLETEREAFQASIKAKSEEADTLRSQLTQEKQAMTELEEDMRQIQEEVAKAAESTGVLKADLATANESIANIQQELEKKKTEVNDLEILVKACDDEKLVYEGKTDTSAKQVARMSAELRTATEERDAAVRKQQEYQETIRGLTVQLSDSKEEAEAQKKLVGERDTTIGDLQKTIASKDSELQAKEEEKSRESTRANDAEKRVSTLETIQEGFLQANEQRITKLKSDLQETYEEGIRSAKTEFETQLEKEKEEIALLRRAVKEIATGEQADIALQDLTEEPSKQYLEVLARKIAASTPTTPSSPLSAMEEKKAQEHGLQQCYNIFLTSYLWGINFPPTEPATPDNIFYSMLQTIFTKGIDPTDRRRPSDPTQSIQRAEIKGLYSTPITIGTKPVSQIQMIRDYLTLVSNLTKATTPDQTVELSDKDIQYAQLLIKQIQKIEDAYTTSGKISESFASFAKNYMIKHQPDIPPSVLDTYIEIQGKQAKSAEAGVLNYSVLFYCFLMLMRDYLNLIRSTGEKYQCPLPIILTLPKQ